jgi:PAS domain S-box-containing protein
MFGRPAQEIVGRPIVDVIGDEAFRTILPHIQSVLKGDRVEFEAEVPYQNAGSRFVHVTYSPERDRRGEISGWVASIFDNTERKRAEARIAARADEQAALYRFTDQLFRARSLAAAYDAALDTLSGTLHCDRASILRFDAKGAMRFVAWRGLSNDYRCAVDGHSPWSPADANPEPVCIADIERAELPAALARVVNEEGIRSLGFFPIVLRGRLAGKFMTYYDAAHAFTPDEVALALNLSRQLGFGIERIETEEERQRTEQELRKLSRQLETEVEKRTRERDRIWDVSEDLLGVGNFEGYFVSINPAWTALLGWTEDEIKSMHVSELRHPDDAAQSLAGRAQLARGVPTVRMENRFRHKNGSWRWIYWTLTAEQGLIYSSGRHITAEKEVAATLERAKQQAAHSQKMEALGQLTGGIAHDFNNLLMIVSGHADMLKRRLDDPKARRSLEAIQIASSRGESLTRQLLSFSRSQPLNPTVLGLADTLMTVRDVISGSLNVNTNLVIDVAPAIWSVSADKSELQLAIINLVVNARDALVSAGGQISISAHNVQFISPDNDDGLAGDFVALSVADNGAGIPADVLDKVFEPFFTTKGADKGTGLGLSQVYGFCRRSGGTVRIESERGRGTKVMMYLPRGTSAVERAVAEDHVRHVAQADEIVLVVEDDQDVRAVAVSLLDQLGYHTVAVEDAPAALEALAATPDIALVFTDVVLPGEVDGLMLARKIKERKPDIPILLTTGYAKVFDANLEFPVLRKPYQIGALERMIGDALATHRAL